MRPGGIAVQGRDRRLALAGLVIAYLVAMVVFSYFASTISNFPGEVTVTTWVQSWRTSWLDSLMNAVSAPGSGIVSASVVVIASALLYLSGRRRETALLLAAVLVAYGLDLGVGEAVGRPRPSGAPVEVLREYGGPSFPSGHVLGSIALLGTLGVILAQGMERGAVRWLILDTMAMALLAVGISRIYLGAHWTGDVVASYAFGAALVAGLALLWRLWAGSDVRSSSPRG